MAGTSVTIMNRPVPIIRDRAAGPCGHASYTHQFIGLCGFVVFVSQGDGDGLVQSAIGLADAGLFDIADDQLLTQRIAFVAGVNHSRQDLLHRGQAGPDSKVRA